jgi:methionine biosynthesis protein MetW
MPDGAGKYDFPVDPDNRNSTYGLICARVPPGSTVLDIGCSSGNLGLALERTRSCRVVGVDVDREAVAVARSRGIEAHVADLTRQRAETVVGPRHFDVIVLADVLEHLTQPAALLAPAAGLLNPGGLVLCSFPNITHVDVQLMLAQDQWRIQPTGILDETHLRFFTEANFAELAFECGFDVAAVERVVLPPLGTEVLEYGRALHLDSKEQEELEAISRRANPNSEVYQYVFELRAAPEREPAAVLSSAGSTPAPESRPGRLDVIVRTIEGRLHYLRDALYSLAGLTYPQLRAIVCVDSSSARYADQVRELTSHLEGLLDVVVTVVPPHQAERGRPLNWGLEQADGEFISFLDDDDVYYPSFGDALISCLRDHPEVTVAYGVGQVVRGEAAPWGFRAVTHVKRYDEPFDRAHLIVENYIPINTLVARREPVLRAGVHFDETLPIYEDWAFLRELAARFEFRFVDSLVSEYRLRTDGSNAVPEGSEERWARTGAQVRQRYRAQAVRVPAHELAELYEKSRELGRTIQELEQRRSAETAALAAELGSVRELNHRLLSSRSWRITRPIRRITGSSLPEDG